MFVTHVHYQDPSLVQPIHNPLRRHTHGTHEEGHLLFDHQIAILCEPARVLVVVRLASIPADLRDEQIYAKWCVGVN